MRKYLSARYIRYTLLNAIEAGDLLLDQRLIKVDEETDETTTDFNIRIYVPEDYDRIYDPNPNALPIDLIDEEIA